MSKSLFDEKFKFTQESLSIDQEVSNSLLPIIQKYVSLGFSPREIAHVIHGAVFELELHVVLGLDYIVKKE